MAGLSMNQLVTAAIVAVVVVFSLKIGNDGIAYAADKIPDISGLELGSPSLSSFTAIPDGSGNMRFQLSLGGVGKSNVELLIYRRYEPTPEKELGVPDFKPENIVFDLLPDTTTESGQKLAAVLEKGVIKKVCPKDADVTKGKNGCDATKGDFKQGGYRFVAVLKKGGKVIDSRTTTAIYGQNYVELLDNPVKDCTDCNVRECKRKVLIDSLRPTGCIYPVSMIYGRVFNELYPPQPQASGPVLKSPELASCQYLPSNLPISENSPKGLKPEDAFKLCPAEEISKLHREAASWIFFRLACEKAGVKDETTKYVEELFKTNNNGLTGLSIVSGETQAKLSECVRKAEQALTNLGWSFSPAPQDRKEYGIPEGSPAAPSDLAQADAMNSINKYLQGELPPLIRNLKAAVDPAGRIKVSWELPVGSNNMKNFGIAYMYRSFLSSSDKFTSAPVLTQLNKADRSYTLTPKGLTGQHRFIVTAESANPVADRSNFPKLEGTMQVAASQSDIGIYNDNYIELYGDLNGVDDVICGKGGWSESGCYVIGKKTEALASDKLGFSGTPKYVLKASADLIASGKVNGNTCKVSDNPGLLVRVVGCNALEVDALYREVVARYAADKGLPSGKTAGDLLKINCKDEEGLIGDSRYKNTGIKEVCDAKSKLKAELEKAKWIYLRW